MPQKGDIVVRIGVPNQMTKEVAIGDMYECVRSNDTWAYYTQNASILPHNFRLATQMETIAFKFGARKISDIAALMQPITKEDILKQIKF